MTFNPETEPPRIALVLDNPLRDLPGLSLLAMELSARGCKVFLVPMYLNDEVFSLAPDFVMLNYFRKISKGYVEALVGNDIQFGILDTEGGPSQDMEQRYLSLLCDDLNLSRAAACVCAWGHESAGVLDKIALFRPGAVAVTGHPRFDIYSEPWRNASSRMAGYVREVPSPFILVCSNFALTTSRYGDRSQVLESLVKNYGFSRAEASGWQDEEEVAIAGMLECLTQLAALFPETTFVYRPHPFEKVEPYLERFAGYKNIRLSKQGDVSAWMLEARLVIQLNCTTCYDAWFARTPSLKPGWIVQESGMGSARAVNHVCVSFAELAANVTAALNQTYDKTLQDSPRNLELVGRYFGTADGRAHTRVADSILGTLDLKTRGQRLQKLAAVKTTNQPPSSGLEKMQALFRGRKNYQSTWTKDNMTDRKKLLERYLSSEKHFAPETVRDWIGEFCKVSDRQTPEAGRAEDSGEYPFGGEYGQSIVVQPLSK